MKRHQINFFATKADLETLLRAIETKQALQFVRTGLFDIPVLNQVQTLLNSNLGIAIKGDSNQEPTYLVSNQTTSIQARTVPQHSGSMKYAIDQQINPKTIAFRPAGVFNDTSVIAGYVGTISEDPASLVLYQLFSKELKKQFEKIKSYYVGKEAGELLDKGWRLTNGVKSPSLYDLTRN